MLVMLEIVDEPAFVGPFDIVRIKKDGGVQGGFAKGRMWYSAQESYRPVRKTKAASADAYRSLIAGARSGVS